MPRAAIWILIVVCGPPVAAQVTDATGAWSYLQSPQVVPQPTSVPHFLPPVQAPGQVLSQVPGQSLSQAPGPAFMPVGKPSGVQAESVGVDPRLKPSVAEPHLAAPLGSSIDAWTPADQTVAPIGSALANATPQGFSGVQRIGSTITGNITYASTHVVRYDVPVADLQTLGQFQSVGIPGRLIEVPTDHKDASGKPETVQLVRYEVPEEEILLHSQLNREGLRGELVKLKDPNAWKPQVRFFQPKARVYFDLKRGNDSQFDLFRNGALAASLDVLEIYKPLSFVQDFFAEEEGKDAKLYNLGWRVGATLGLGITTALANGGQATGAPVGVASMGLRYEFPIGPMPPAMLDQSGKRVFLDQRTRVGFEMGIQVGTTADETIADRFDAGFYVGMLVNTPW